MVGLRSTRRGARRIAVAALVTALAVPVVFTASASVAGAAGGSTVRVSVSSQGEEGNGYSYADSISGNGRFVVYASLSSNLVPDDTNNRSDIFLFDRTTWTTERISVASNGDEADGASSAPSISDDGRFVTFMSGATNLSPGTGCQFDDNACDAVFVRDRVAGTTTLVTVPTAPEDINGFTNDRLAISSDGNLIAFCSGASNLVAGDTNGKEDVFLRDVAAGTTERLSVASNGDEADGPCWSVVMSGDGRFVAFDAAATNLAAGGTSAGSVFVLDRQLDTIEARGVSGPDSIGTFNPTISDDGRYVAYISYDDLAPEDNNSSYDPYLEDRLTNTKTKVNRTVDGVDGFANDVVRISGDGRSLFFRGGGYLAPGATVGTSHLYIRSVADGTITLANVTSSGDEITNPEYGWGNPLSDDGSLMSFSSANATIVGGDENNTHDIFVRQVTDTIAPSVSISSPVDGAQMTQSESVVAQFECNDDWSGIASCIGSTPDGAPLDTSTLGTHTLTVTATDSAGNVTQRSASYTVLGPEMKFNVDPGGSFTPTEPTSSAPVTTLPTEGGLTGSYIIRLAQITQFTHVFKVTEFHLESSAGTTFDLAGSASLTCWDTLGSCEPEIPVYISGLASATTGVIRTTGLAIGRPAWEGPELDPSGYNWAPPNTFVPAGVSMYQNGDSGLEIIGVVAFHATRTVVDRIPPVVTIASPIQGATFLPGEVVAADYACSDAGGSGLATCDGTVANGAPIDTTLGSHSLQVTATDGFGNFGSAYASYTVQGPEMTFNLSPGGVFTPTVPTSSAPVTLLPAQTVASGSYKIALASIGQFDYTYRVTAFHVETNDGVTLDLSSPGSLTCYPQYGMCQPTIPVAIGGLPTATNATIQTTGMAIGTPTWSGPVTDPSAFNWAPGNTFVPAGIGVYGSGPIGLAMVGVVSFSATRLVPVPPDTTPPVVTITSPADGASYTLDQVVTAAFSCSDTGGSGVASCAGTQADGSALDTSSAGLHTFTVNATDGEGNAAAVTNTYEVLAGNVSSTVTGGETITTDPGGLGASPVIPIQTAIAVPGDVSGQISVASQPAGTGPPGFTLFSRELVITGPPASSPADPYSVTFTVDATELGATTPSGVAIFRNGVLVADCISPTDATPDPCVAERAAGSGGDAVITVRTTAFSTWTIGRRSFVATSAAPSSVARGVTNRTISVSGDGFATGVKARFSGTGITVSSTTRNSAESLTLIISISGTATLGARNIIVTNPGSVVATCTECFTVTPRPVITAIDPGSRPVGTSHQTVTVSGSGFQAGATATFSGSGVTIHAVDFVDEGLLVFDLSIAADAATGNRTLTVTNPDGGIGTKSRALRVNSRPTVTTVAPNRLRQAQTMNVVLRGSGFAADFGTAGGTIDLGPDIVVSSVVRNSASKLTATVAIGAEAAAGLRGATVTNPDGGGGSCLDCLTVVADPSITALDPAARSRGTTHQLITITGTGFATGVKAKISGSGVTVHSTTFNSATSLTVDITVGGSATLGSRSVTVTNTDTGTTTCTGCFTVNAKPTITGASPNSGSRGASNLAVALTGTGFQPGMTVAFSGTGVTATVLSVTPTTATLEISVAANAATGNRTATVVNTDGGTASRTSTFRVTT